jgi:hypothetical protein
MDIGYWMLDDDLKVFLLVTHHSSLSFPLPPQRMLQPAWPYMARPAFLHQTGSSEGRLSVKQSGIVAVQLSAAISTRSAISGNSIGANIDDG